MKSYAEVDHWNEAVFEDMCARTLIALNEKTLNPQALRNGVRSVTADTLAMIRRTGAIVPAPDREFWNPEVERKLDLKELPLKGCFSFGEELADPDNADKMSGYCRLVHFRRVPKLPSGWQRFSMGAVYEVVQVFAHHLDPLDALREFVTIHPTTQEVIPCMRTGDRTPRTAHEAQVPGYLVNAGMQTIDDLRHQWTIKSYSGESSVTVGAYAENVKSLLYARSLPMTASGRKRPILHAVAAHKRRLKSGIEIDITPFLRGVHTVKMDDALFEVRAPDRLVEEIELKKTSK